jgi:methyl-accepting chemotaxis protein
MNLRIGAQLGIALGFLLLMIVFTICLGVGGTHKVNESVEEIAKGSYNRTTYSFQASKGFDDAIASIRMLVILKDMNAMNLEKQKIETAMGRYSEAMNKLDEMEKTGNGKRLIANLKDVAAPAVKANNAVMELALAHKQDEAVALLLNKALPLAQQVEEAFAVQTKFQHENVDAAYKRSKAVYTRTKLIQIIGGVLSAFLGLLAAVYLTRHLSSRLKNLAIAMGRIAEGDFSRQINISGNDEIGELGCRINQMQASVKSMITAITGTASEVAASANMLNLVSEQIASSSGEVAGQAGTVATASEQMAATSTEIAHNCNTAAESSRQGNELAAEGAQVVMETVASMNDIAERVKQTASTLERLGSRSDQIGEIVGTIEDIADQTNLLALNAAIEAARGWRAGAWFRCCCR